MEEIQVINEEIVTGGLLQSKAGKFALAIGGLALLATAGYATYKKVIIKRTKKEVNAEVNETDK